MPRTDRDSITGHQIGPAQVTMVIESDETRPLMATLFVGVCSGKSHNEVQALMGIWRT
jgi:hypothetical protein